MNETEFEEYKKLEKERQDIIKQKKKQKEKKKKD